PDLHLRRPRRNRLLQPRQVQPGDFCFRADLLPVRSAGEVSKLCVVATEPGAGVLRRGWRGRRVCAARRGSSDDRASSEGDGVAGCIRPSASEEPIPFDYRRQGSYQVAHPSAGCCPGCGTLRWVGGRRAPTLLCCPDTEQEVSVLLVCTHPNEQTIQAAFSITGPVHQIVASTDSAGRHP